MMLKNLALRYIRKTERVFNVMKMNRNAVFIDVENIKEIIDEAKRYLEDAKFYFEKRRFETSLVSVSYCEGLLDALRLLGLVYFSWEEAE